MFDNFGKWWKIPVRCSMFITWLKLYVEKRIFWLAILALTHELFQIRHGSHTRHFRSWWNVKLKKKTLLAMKRGVNWYWIEIWLMDSPRKWTGIIYEFYFIFFSNFHRWAAGRFNEANIPNFHFSSSYFRLTEAPFEYFILENWLHLAITKTNQIYNRKHSIVWPSVALKATTGAWMYSRRQPHVTTPFHLHLHSILRAKRWWNPAKGNRNLISIVKSAKRII